MTVEAVRPQARPALATAPFGSFRQIFPWLSKVLASPWIVTVLLGMVAAGLTIYSRHLAIAVSSIWYFYLCVRIEKRHLDRLIIPPLAIFGLYNLMASGLGLPLFWCGIALVGDNYPDLDNAVWKCQICYAFAFPMLMAGYWVFSRGSPPFRLPPTRDPRPIRTLNTLYVIGWLLLIQYLIYFISGIVTGSSDRSRTNEFVARGFGVWSFFQLLPRLNFMFFVLSPLVFKKSHRLGRLIISGSISTILVLLLFGGSRTALLIPIFQMLIGWWMFCTHSRRAIIVTISACLFALPYLILAPFYRSSDAFLGTRQTDIVGRVNAAADLWPTLKSSDPASVIEVTGESLNGVDDRDIFLRTPEDIPYAGWENISRLKNFWLPSIISPTKGILLDGDEIVRRYKDDDSIFGSGISFSADMYRRFSWPGIFIGNFILGAFLGGFFRFAFKCQSHLSPVIGTLLVIYSLSFIPSVPYSSLLSTCWMWLWELPKHLVALVFLIALARVFLTLRQTSESLDAK